MSRVQSDIIVVIFVPLRLRQFRLGDREHPNGEDDPDHGIDPDETEKSMMPPEREIFQKMMNIITDIEAEIKR